MEHKAPRENKPYPKRDFKGGGYKGGPRGHHGKSFPKRVSPEEYQWFKVNQKKINALLEEAKYLANRAKRSIEGDREQFFLKQNRGKSIKLALVNGSFREGELVDISMYGILLKVNDEEAFIFKKAIMYYTLA